MGDGEGKGSGVSGSEPIVRFVDIDKTYDGVTRVVDDLHLGGAARQAAKR